MTTTLHLVAVFVLLQPSAAYRDMKARILTLSEQAFDACTQGRANEGIELFYKAKHLIVEIDGETSEEAAINMGNIAVCLDKAQRYKEAERAYRKASDLYADPEKRKIAIGKAEAMRAMLFGSLSITCNDRSDRARVQLIGPDNTKYQPFPCRQTKAGLPIGRYHILGISGVGLQVTEDGHVTGNRKTTVHLEFPAGLRVNGIGGYPVYIDDVPIGGLPAGRDDLTPGRHTVRVELPDQAPFIDEVDIPPGERIELTVTPTERPVTLPRVYVPPPEPDDELRAALPWVLGVGALSVGAIGGVFLYNAESAEDLAHTYAGRYARACPLTEDGTRPAGPRCDQDLLQSNREAGEQALDEARLDRTIGWIAVGTSVALLGAATWTFIDAWPAPIGRLDVSLDGTGAALWLTGEF